MDAKLEELVEVCKLILVELGYTVIKDEAVDRSEDKLLSAISFHPTKRAKPEYNKLLRNVFFSFNAQDVEFQQHSDGTWAIIMNCMCIVPGLENRKQAFQWFRNNVYSKDRKKNITLAKKGTMYCSMCDSTNIRTIFDIGYDIDSSGEERQHLQECIDCGARRRYDERWDNFIDHSTHYGNWGSGSNLLHLTQKW